MKGRPFMNSRGTNGSHPVRELSQNVSGGPTGRRRFRTAHVRGRCTSHSLRIAPEALLKAANTVAVREGRAHSPERPRTGARRPGFLTTDCHEMSPGGVRALRRHCSRQHWLRAPDRSAERSALARRRFFATGCHEVSRHRTACLQATAFQCRPKSPERRQSCRDAHTR